jgi:hypothetical protein
VILSPGSRDTLAGVPHETFARTLDVLIDIARGQDAPPDLLLVSPPPLVSNPRRSARYARAVRVLAEQHRLPFVDLHELLMKRDDWKSYYQRGADDAVYYLYPNHETQRRFAEAILKEID